MNLRQQPVHNVLRLLLLHLQDQTLPPSVLIPCESCEKKSSISLIPSTNLLLALVQPNISFNSRWCHSRLSYNCHRTEWVSQYSNPFLSSFLSFPFPTLTDPVFLLRRSIDGFKLVTNLQRLPSKNLALSPLLLNPSTLSRQL